MAKRKKNGPVTAATMTTLSARLRGATSAPTPTTYSRQAAADTASSATAAKAPPSDEPLDLAAARHEVFQLGLEGLSRARRRQARQQKLISLGAKPPPRAATNYRQLMAETKEKRVRDKEEKEALKKSGLALPNVEGLLDKKGKFKKPRNNNKVRGFDGQPGRFKKGVQIVPRRVRKS